MPISRSIHKTSGYCGHRTAGGVQLPAAHGCFLLAGDIPNSSSDRSKPVTVSVRKSAADRSKKTGAVSGSSDDRAEISGDTVCAGIAKGVGRATAENSCAHYAEAREISIETS